MVRFMEPDQGQCPLFAQLDDFAQGVCVTFLETENTLF